MANPCANNGVCIENCGDEADYYCNCTSQFTGKNCTEEVSSNLFDWNVNGYLKRFFMHSSFVEKSYTARSSINLFSNRITLKLSGRN